ncbi:MAG: hypothetical protein JXA91_07940, partial [Candidatus Thermoplasmatota archaeon]|nr:hypothetical protein [Candidatus Thermoplasmatota archaeon]
MDKKLGQTDSEWRTQIEQLPAVKNLWGKKKRQAIEMVMHYLGLSTELGAILKDVEYRVDANFGRIGRGVEQQAFVKIEGPYYSEDMKDFVTTPYEEESIYQTIWTKEQDIRQEIINEIRLLYDKGYLQRLKSADKTGIIDAIFIKKVGEKRVREGKDQIDYAAELSIPEWERLYRQATKIALMQGIEAIPFVDIDKHFCEMFDMNKAKKIRVNYDKIMLNEAWKGTITTSICMIKRLIASDKKKRQADYLTLVIFYHILLSQCEEMIRDTVASCIKKLIENKKIPQEKIHTPSHISSRLMKTILNETIPFYIDIVYTKNKKIRRNIDKTAMENLKRFIFNKTIDYFPTDRNNFMQ